ncbi:ankyrin repeat domain-containing protein (plasmid) [Borrelia turcica IST7]|uniref:Ankyrin repeat domain-containing protein n=1 Tax=Borrelia turcica IST7 TaxID=1104446 RepID=A0A386PNH8_9SPIR|nr:ankyrin repeat domain-containing protein [Borrelia turcica]AYE37024.1 ankyrin repeat domain-containing protein [Borrelia turcica IST7]
MSNYTLHTIFIYLGYIIIGITSFTIFNKNLREKIKRRLKKFNFLYYLTLFMLFILSSNLSYYFSEKQLLEDFNDFEKDFFEIHKINETFLQTYLLSFKEPIKMELMSQVKPIYTIFNATFEKYSKNINKPSTDIATNYNNYIKAMNTEIKNRIAILEEEILPVYNKYKLPFLNNKISDISVDKDGNIIPVIKDLRGQITDLLFYDKSYNLIPFKKHQKYEVKFDLIKDNNAYFKEILNIYYIDSNNSQVPIDYYKNNIDTIPYYIDLKENKNNFLKSIKIKNEYKSYIEEKRKLQELIKKDNLNEFKAFLEQNQNNFSLNTIFSDGNPMFTYAVNSKSKNIIDYMMLQDFDINLVDSESKNVLHNAISNEYDTDFIKSLIEKGVNPNIRDSYKKLPLDYAPKDSTLYQYLETITNK